MAQFLNVALPEDSLWWHTPNQAGSRSAVETKILKGMGVKPGIPDILIFYQGRLFAIELKAKGGKESPNQEAMQETLRELGAEVASGVTSVEAVEKVLRGWSFPLHASALGLPTTRHLAVTGLEDKAAGEYLDVVDDLRGGRKR